MARPDDLIDHILKKGPSQGTLLLVLTQLKEAGLINKVIQECIRALDFYSDDIRLRRLLAEAYFEAGLIGQAEAELGRLTSELKDLSSVYKLQARILARQKRLEEAEVSLRTYLAANHDDQEALELLDSIAARIGVEKGVEAGELSPKVEAEPEMAQAWEPVEEGLIEEEEETPFPEEEEDAIVDLASPTIAELYFSQGQVLEAISTYEKILLKDPEDKLALSRLAELNEVVAKAATPSQEHIARQNTLKTIAIMEDWLARIRVTNTART
jgi:tetratricopeptide (TPR) repeat protein